MPETKSCQELLQGLSAYIDDEAGEMICRQIERHIVECDNCRIMLDTLQKTISLYQIADSADEMPLEIQERLLETIHLEDIRSETNDNPKMNG